MAKTSMARLLTFEYQRDPNIMKATGANIDKINQRAALSIQRNEQPGYSLYDALERGRISGNELMALAIIGFIEIIKNNRPVFTINFGDPNHAFTDKEKAILRAIDPAEFDKLPSEIADKIRKAIDE